MSAVDTADFVPNQNGRDYDLLQRSTAFSKQVVLFAKSIPPNLVNNRLLVQFLDAGTSVGANYNEADDASSPRDYRAKVCICRKESKESMFWLHMLAVANPKRRDEAAVLWQEAKELNLIFGKIIRICDSNLKTKPHDKQTQRPK